MKLIVGLGNPGTEYAKTRHNLGFMVVDHIAKLKELEFYERSKFSAEISEFQVGDEKVVLAKPTTFMNDSGQAVQALSHFYKLTHTDTWVVSDDLDLEFGKVRVRIGGSSGGHNGLKSIIDKVGESFVRFRIGIKTNNLAKIGAHDYVLQRFGQAEEEQLPGVIAQTEGLIKKAFAEGVEHTSSSL
ncbi:aminoacyl-tRNA hydrolase [Candidatus Saccharibacteria bacterium]|nr:aminoacyl-tRNA hydrolase [Candidatus Saccharibacteria bacterium]